MGIRKVLRNLLPLVAISCACAFAQIGTSGTANRTAQNSVRPFLGRWDMTLRTPEREYPSWLEIYQVNGAIKANMVGRWGSAHPLPKVEISHGVLTFTSPRKYEGRKTDMDFRAKLIGDALVGSTTGPHGKPWPWTAKRVPALIRTAEPRWGKRISLFNGKNLDGWYQYPSPDSPQAQPWKVVNGILISPAVGSNLATKRKFEDFKLHVEFNCGPVSNSGVYLRGRYEVQIENDSVKEPPSHHTGGIYGFIAPSPELPRTTGKWQSFDITFSWSQSHSGTGWKDHRRQSRDPGNYRRSHE